jgi:hypothetical protein
MSRAHNEMATQRDRRKAAELLRRIVKALPERTPTQVAFLFGRASGLTRPANLPARQPRSPRWSPRSARHRPLISLDSTFAESRDRRS